LNYKALLLLTADTDWHVDCYNDKADEVQKQPYQRSLTMNMIQTIMAAVDFSDHSLPTVRYAAKLAHDLNASLILVNVFNERDVRAIHSALATYDSSLYQKTIDQRIAERKSQLSDLALAAEATTFVTKQIVRTDVPYQGLLRTIEEEKPDLLIMGIKGRGAFADTIVGSCAQKMYRRSPIPLLSLRSEK
jgi:nucleotide-binding universal stress UspA family protein